MIWFGYKKNKLNENIHKLIFWLTWQHVTHYNWHFSNLMLISAIDQLVFRMRNCFNGINFEWMNDEQEESRE